MNPVSAHAVSHLKTNQRGIAVLPRLRPGNYSLHALAEPGYEGDLYLQVSRSNRDSLQPFALETFCCTPRSPPWYDEQFAAAKNAPIEATLQRFHLRIMDQSGAGLEMAEVGIGRVGAEEFTRAATLHSDKDGRVAASLSTGDYLAILSASGFKRQTLHFVISDSGDPAERVIVLKVMTT